MAPNCIDVCSFNGNIDWKKVRASGVKFAILRTIRKGLVVDEAFERNYTGAQIVGINVGVYLYTYAKSAAYARQEADSLLSLLRGRKLDCGVWFDMETGFLRSSSRSTVQGIAEAFRNKITAAGYNCGIYCDKDFYSLFKGFDSSCSFWVASYGANDGKQHSVPGIGHHLFGHQFSDKGRVDGISGYVDISRVYGISQAVHAKKPMSIPQIMPGTLRRGDSGEAVIALQLALNSALGCSLVSDGYFGAMTESAVKEFQKRNKLSVDGIAGPKTWEKLL